MKDIKISIINIVLSLGILCSLFFIPFEAVLGYDSPSIIALDIDMWKNMDIGSGDVVRDVIAVIYNIYIYITFAFVDFFRLDYRHHH